MTAPEFHESRLTPHAGQYAVVVTFRVAPPSDPAMIEAYVRDHLADVRGLTIHVRVIGAAGESSADEDRWDAPPSHQDAPRRPQGGA